MFHLYDKNSISAHMLLTIPAVTNCHFLGPLPLQRDVLYGTPPKRLMKVYSSLQL